MASPPQGENTGDGDFESLSADQQTVGGTGPVTGIFADENEWVPLFPINNYQYNNSWTVTSYSGDIHSGARRFGFDPTTLPSLTGIGTYGVALWATGLSNDTAGETASIRLLEESGTNDPYATTEIQVTGTTPIHEVSPVEELTDDTPKVFGVEGKVSAGTGSVKYYKAIICGRVE